MRSIYSSIVFILSALSLNAQKEADELIEEGLKKYPLEKGVLTYEVTGDATGTEFLYFDQFGWKSLKKQTLHFNLYEIEKTQDLAEIIDGDYSYRLYDDSTYSKKINKRWSNLAHYKDPYDVSESILFSMNGTYHSDSTLMGKPCQVWVFDNKRLREMWIWEGLVLRRISKLGSLKIKTTATSIDLDPTFSQQHFQLPNYYTLRKNDE